MTFTPRDAKDVSNLVAKKLELYMNVERREDRFDPQGYLRTTPKMKTMDLMYQMLDKAELNGKSKNSPRERRHPSPRDRGPEGLKGRKSSREKKERTKDKETDGGDNKREGNSEREKNKKRERQKMIRPKLVDNSRCVVPRKEADRITLTVNKIFEEQDLDRLHVIHRYRPHSPDVAALTENGKVLGYTRHVGSALHGDHYVDFYLKEGLQTGKAEHSKRLQRLKEEKEKSDTRSTKTIGRDSSSMKSQDTGHDWASKSKMRDILSPLASSTSYESVSSAGASGRRTPSSQRPVYTTFLSSTPMSSRASAGQTLESKLGYKVLNKIEDGKSAVCLDSGRGEGGLLAGEKWEAGCCDGGGGRQMDDSGTDVMGAGSVSARQESRAELASSEDYCKFSAGKDTSSVSESRQDVESVLSKNPAEGAVRDNEEEPLKTPADPIYLRDVQMSYKRYRNPDAGFVLTGLGAAEISPRGFSGLVSARSTQSEPAKPSRRRSVRSRNNLPSEISPFPTTVSEDGSSTTRTICSSSVISSTPRKALSHREPIRPIKDKGKGGSQSLEPVRAVLETPDVPRLGLTSDLNDTNRSLFSNGRMEPAEDYTTAEQLVRQHPDTRASEGGVSSRARERDYANKDGRAEERCFEDIKLKDGGSVGLQGSMIDEDNLMEINANPEVCGMPAEVVLDGNSIQTAQKNNEKTISESTTAANTGKVETDRQSVKSGSSRQSSSSSRGSKNSKREQVTPNASLSQAATQPTPTLEIERGEDQGRNTELDRGHETPGSSTGTSHREKKKAIERGDDLSETLQEENRLSQSARRRGQSQYRTTTRSERGMEREYFTPHAHQAEQYVLPNDAQMEDSLVDASELNSRPSSAASSDTSQVSGGKRKKKSLRRFSKSSNVVAPEQEPVVRPTSAASEDGRGDDSNSVASGPQTSASNQVKQSPGEDEEVQRPASATSQVSQKSQVTARSVSSRGSVNGKDRPGKRQSYHVANAESFGRGSDDNSHQAAPEVLVEARAQTSVSAAKEAETQQLQITGEAASNVAEIKTNISQTERLGRETMIEPLQGEKQVLAGDKMSRVSSAKSDVEHVEQHTEGQSLQEKQVLTGDKASRVSSAKSAVEHVEQHTEGQSLQGKQASSSSEALPPEKVKIKEEPARTSPETVCVQDEESNREKAEQIDQGHKSPPPVSGEVVTGTARQVYLPEDDTGVCAGQDNYLGMGDHDQMVEQNKKLGQSHTGHAPSKDDGPSGDVAAQEKAFIDSSDTTEIVKAPVSASVSLEADNTVIDFRPSSASTAKSFTVDHENGNQQTVKEKQRVKAVQPSRIVEVTESEGTPTPGRDTHRAIYSNNEIIQTNYVTPTQAMKNKQGADTEQVLDLAKISAGPHMSEDIDVLHPGMKKRDSKSSIRSKNSASEEKDGPLVNTTKDREDNIANISLNQKKIEAQNGKNISTSTNKTTDLKMSNGRPPSASSQKSIDKAKVDERPPSASSQKLEDKVKVNERSPSASSQKLEDKVKVDERPPSASSQKLEDNVKVDERPPSASSQKSSDKVKVDERSPSASSQKLEDKVKVNERPPSASSQKLEDKVKVNERPPSASSQKLEDKTKVDERPPSASSQKLEDKAKVDERPPSASSQKSSDKVKVDGKSPS
ncbi:hypothetical protein ElyMa_002193900 [Elysia marginata]|uniref:Microtubule-associated protein futsch-like n=1 Tax=Elysia marginata TaxID=1093978 RepID=A0AAV4FQP7_9GAST|nr:hypothetical protein ElyMa_002193900 [Elysia marginata]